MRTHLITGGTGFVGRHLVKKLLSEGEQVILLTRSSGAVGGEERAKKEFRVLLNKYGDRLQFVEGDITKDNIGISPYAHDSLKMQDVVFWHLAANLSFATNDKDAVYKTNHSGTREVVRFANKFASQIIYVSTAFVCGNIKGLIEEDRLIENVSFRNHYEQSKYQAEQYVRKSSEKPFTIFRPSIIIGDVYEGNADGCTFGYYRFSFMFYLLRKWIIGKWEKGGLAYRFLKLLRVSYKSGIDVLYIPWLILPLPSRNKVDLVPVDYCVDSMVKIVLTNSALNKTYHLTHNNPPGFEFLVKSLFKDLGYDGVKFFAIPTFLFLIIVRLLYFITYPIRIYTKSVYWYLPYFTETYEFSRNNTENIGIPSPKEITEDYIGKVNMYARKDVFTSVKDFGL